jgi:Spy/CpxP family protein refolding chaperone
MSKIALAKTIVVAGGLLSLWLSAAPELALGQSSQPGAVPPAPMKSALALRAKSAAQPDLLEGLTLTDDQKVKIDRIRAEARSRLASVANDQKLSPEAADAMRRGYQRFENVKILEVLTPEQQQEVRKRIAAVRGAAGKPQYPLRRLPGSAQTPRPQ